jgi:hypothetical protein
MLTLALLVAAGAWTSARATDGDAAPFGRRVDTPATVLDKSRLARSAIGWAGGPTTAATGESVSVYVSASLSPELGTPQTWADFIAGLQHGEEISSLTAYVGTLDEIRGICGENALGCYAADRLVSMGETAFGVTAAEVVRHEYGHHIAYHRVNPPWSAIDWGPKNWASSLDVCERVEDGRAYPGNESNYYSLNPGEAWAETYRLLDEREAGVIGSTWEIVDGRFYPDEAALAATERDVLQPWASPHGLRFSRSFGRKTRRVWLIPLRTPLDGSLEITVSLPKNGLQDVSLLDSDRKTVLATGLWSSRREKRLTTTVCGERTLFVRIAQKGAFGRVVVRASVP